MNDFKKDYSILSFFSYKNWAIPILNKPEIFKILKYACSSAMQTFFICMHFQGGTKWVLFLSCRAPFHRNVPGSQLASSVISDHSPRQLFLRLSILIKTGVVNSLLPKDTHILYKGPDYFLQNCLCHMNVY